MAGVGQALAQLQAGELGEAEQICQAAMADEEQRPDALHILGLVAHRRGNPSQALAFMKDAVRADPRNGDRRLELGLLAFNVGSDYDAVAHLEALIAGCGEVPAALNCLGKALSRLGHPKAAVDRLERAVAAAPRWAKAWLDLASAYRTAGRPMAAARALEGAYRHAPDEQILLALATTLSEAGHTQRACSHLKKLVRQNHGHVVAWTLLGNNLRAMGQLDQAQKAHREAVTTAPYDASAQVELARTELLLGNLREAFERLEWRQEQPDYPTPGKPWSGPPTAVNELTVWADGTPGETLLLARFVPQLTRHADRVRFAVQPELLALLRTGWTEAERVDLCSMSDVGADAVTIGLASVPRLVREGDVVPQELPYLRMDGEPRLGSTGTIRRSATGSGPHTGVRLVGRDLGHPERAAIQQALRTISAPTGSTFETLSPTHDTDVDLEVALANSISGLDLVVTDDELTAHVAAAMGKRVWFLCCFERNHYLGLSGNGFYDGMSLFRSSSAASWREAVSAINNALEAEAQITRAG